MILLALLVSGLLIWLIIWAIRGTKAKEAVVAAILASAATVGVAILTSALSSYTTKEKEIRDAYRLQKIEVYTKFVDLVISTIQETKDLPKKEMDESEYQAESEQLSQSLVAAYVEFAKRLLLWGSPKVIKEYGSWAAFNRESILGVTNEDGASKLERGLRFTCHTDRVFETMRNDLGLDNFGLERGDLIGIFLNDPEEVRSRIGNYCK